MQQMLLKKKQVKHFLPKKVRNLKLKFHSEIHHSQNTEQESTKTILSRKADETCNSFASQSKASSTQIKLKSLLGC